MKDFELTIHDLLLCKMQYLLNLVLENFEYLWF